MLTSPDVFLTHSEVTQVLMQLRYVAPTDLPGMIPPPAVCLPERLWAGVQIMSVVLPAQLPLYHDYLRTRYLNGDVRSPASKDVAVLSRREGAVHKSEAASIARCSPGIE